MIALWNYDYVLEIFDNKNPKILTYRVKPTITKTTPNKHEKTKTS